jgi:hypothetical protein
MHITIIEGKIWESEGLIQSHKGEGIIGGRIGVELFSLWL